MADATLVSMSLPTTSFTSGAPSALHPNVENFNPKTGATYLRDPNRVRLSKPPRPTSRPFNRYATRVANVGNALGPAQNVGSTAETSFSTFAEQGLNNPNARSASARPDTSQNQRRNPNLRRRYPLRQPTARPDTRINIEPLDIAETAPLLPGASAAAGGSGAASVLGSVLGVGGAIAAGAATTALVNRTKEKGAVLPGTEFVGPFNDVPIGAARHEADAIAKEHDKGYEDAGKETDYSKFAAQIGRLDREAQIKFAKDWEHAGRWQSLVGKYGLQVKQLIEGILGHPVYPSFSGKWANLRIFLQINGQIGTS